MLGPSKQIMRRAFPYAIIGPTLFSNDTCMNMSAARIYVNSATRNRNFFQRRQNRNAQNISDFLVLCELLSLLFVLHFISP